MIYLFMTAKNANEKLNKGAKSYFRHKRRGKVKLVIDRSARNDLRQMRMGNRKLLHFVVCW